MQVLVFMTRMMHDGMGYCGHGRALARERKTSPRNTQGPMPEECVFKIRSPPVFLFAKFLNRFSILS